MAMTNEKHSLHVKVTLYWHLSNETNVHYTDIGRNNMTLRYLFNQQALTSGLFDRAFS